jgi:hypothetical protein
MQLQVLLELLLVQLVILDFLSYSHPKIISSLYMAIKYGFSVLFKDFVRTAKLLFILYAFESFVFNLRF